MIVEYKILKKRYYFIFLNFSRKLISNAIVHMITRV